MKGARALVLAGLVATLGAAGAASPQQAQDPPKPAEKAPLRESSPEIQAAIDRGLAWLSKNQNSSGSFGSGGAPVATTSIAGMAFLSGGHHPGRSKYGENVKKALRYILKCCSNRGYINEGTIRGAGGSGMHGHGYATMFLAECYGMTADLPDFETDMIKEKLSKAIGVIETSQCPNGGWNYEPDPSYDEGSVTVTQVQALRAARNAGIKVSTKTIEKAVDYINKSTDANGQTRYSLTSGGHVSFALTAAGMTVLNYLGAYENPKIKKGLDFVLQSMPGGGGNNANMGAWGGWYFYANYYATLACYQAAGPYWAKWWPSISVDMVKTQDKSGCWKQGESQAYGDAFGTGFALQILQVPNRYNPIYQRGSD